jgi:hypothetical protein
MEPMNKARPGYTGLLSAPPWQTASVTIEHSNVRMEKNVSIVTLLRNSGVSGTEGEA